MHQLNCQNSASCIRYNPTASWTLWQTAYFKTFPIINRMAILCLGRKQRKGNHFIKLMFVRPLPAANHSDWQEIKGWGQNTNPRRATQNLSTAQPTGLCDSVQFNCMLRKERNLPALVLIAKNTLSFSEPSV